MACISYLDISSSSAHLHYLMQRLRQRLPNGTPILVGLRPTKASTLKDPKVKAEVGADYFTSSLEEAVAACADAGILSVACTLPALAQQSPSLSNSWMES